MTQQQPANAVILIADRSGSMANLLDNTIKSLNSYLEELRDRPAPKPFFAIWASLAFDR